MRKSELLASLRDMGFEVDEYSPKQHLGKFHVKITWPINRNVVELYTILCFGSDPMISARDIAEIKRKFQRYCPAVGTIG